MYTKEDFNKITDIFASSVSGLKALYLFGSYARGDAREGSDADLAAIVEVKPVGSRRKDLLNRLYNQSSGSGYRVDIVFKTESEFDVDKNVPVTLSHTIATQGRLLWPATDSVK